jgi:ammonium transporter Rh
MFCIILFSLIFGDFAAAVVLISYGTVIGVATPLQLILMTFSEVVFYALNDYIGSEVLKAVDTGGSMYVHIFAAYFGLGLSRGLMSAKDVNTSNLSASYNSNIFCLIGNNFNLNYNCVTHLFLLILLLQPSCFCGSSGPVLIVL